MNKTQIVDDILNLLGPDFVEEALVTEQTIRGHLLSYTLDQLQAIRGQLLGLAQAG